MTKIVLKNPYFEEEIKVKEDRKYILDSIDNLDYGNINCILLNQVEPVEAIITISPKQFAKIEIYEEVE
jgi:hypothetical protein